MSQITDLNAIAQKISDDISPLTAGVTSVGNDVSTVISMLKDAQAAGTPVDISTALTTLQNADGVLNSLNTHLSNTDAQLQATIKPVTLPPVTTPPDGTGTGTGAAPTVVDTVTNADGSTTVDYSDGSTQTTSATGEVTTTPPVNTTPNPPINTNPTPVATPGFAKK